MKKVFGVLLVGVPLLALAALPYTFQSGQVISAAEINSNFAYLNARIDGLTSSTSSSAGELVYKTEFFNGREDAFIMKNDSAKHIDVAVDTNVGKILGVVKCSGGQEFISTSLYRVFPGCSFYLRPDSLYASVATYAYQVSYYRQ